MQIKFQDRPKIFLVTTFWGGSFGARPRMTVTPQFFHPNRSDNQLRPPNTHGNGQFHLKNIFFKHLNFKMFLEKHTGRKIVDRKQLFATNFSSEKFSAHPRRPGGRKRPLRYWATLALWAAVWAAWGRCWGPGWGSWGSWVKVGRKVGRLTERFFGNPAYIALHNLPKILVDFFKGKICPILTF